MASGVGHEAEASISTASDKIKLADGTLADALVVRVKLQLTNGTKTPAERMLAFWFVKGKGIIKREIGSGSKREPDNGR